VSKRNVMVIGGSAGAPAVLHQLVSGLPEDLDAAVFVVTHVPVHGAMLLAGLLDAAGALPVRYAQDGDPIVPGQILVGRPDRHLMLTADGVRLGGGPRENLARPAIDPLFRSAAASFGGRVIGVLLTGMLNDGAAGLLAIKQCGGTTVVQDPLDAFAPDMPRAALHAVDVDHVATAAGLAPLLASLTREDAPLGRAASPQVRLEVDVALGARLGTKRLLPLAKPSTFSCPECEGVLSEVQEEGPLRYRCQTGHALTGAILADCQDEALDRAIGVAMRIIEERIALVQRLVDDARLQGNTAAAELHEARARDYREQAEILRRAILPTVEARPEPPDETAPHDAEADLA
jgi:two-component system, chemotaxis family, protein-glutamate methylesterase/glutaminase